MSRGLACWQQPEDARGWAETRRSHNEGFITTCISSWESTPETRTLWSVLPRSLQKPSKVTSPPLPRIPRKSFMGRPFMLWVLFVAAFLMMSFSPGFGRKTMGPLHHANSAAVSFQEKWVVYQRDYEQAGPNVHSQPALLSPPPPPSSPPLASPPSLQY
nr:uncharacterized protein LOC101490238 [Ipomoea batatas]